MAMPELVAGLEQEARLRIGQIDAAADAEVRTIEAASTREAARAAAEVAEARRAARRPADARELADGRRQARARELTAMHALIARVLARAREQTPAFALLAEYREALPRHAAEALTFVGASGRRLCCPPALAPLLQPLVERDRDVTLVADDTADIGVIVEADDRSVVVDNTIAARLLRAESWLRIELARRLGDGGR